MCQEYLLIWIEQWRKLPMFLKVRWNISKNIWKDKSFWDDVFGLMRWWCNISMCYLKVPDELTPSGGLNLWVKLSKINDALFCVNRESQDIEETFELLGNVEPARRCSFSQKKSIISIQFRFNINQNRLNN